MHTYIYKQNRHQSITCHFLVCVSQNSGAQGLPRIIGDSDLEVHIPKRSKELEDWMKESVEVGCFKASVFQGNIINLAIQDHDPRHFHV